MSRSNRLVKLVQNRNYRNFEIEQADPNVEKLGVGPYRLTYNGKEIVKKSRHSECRDHLEELIREHRRVLEDFGKKKKEFCSKWRLPNFPEKL